MEVSHEIRIAVEITKESEAFDLDIMEFRTAGGRYGVMARIKESGEVYSIRTWSNKEDAGKYWASMHHVRRSH